MNKRIFRFENATGNEMTDSSTRMLGMTKASLLSCVVAACILVAAGCEKSTPPPPPPLPLQPLHWSITPVHIEGVIKKDNGVYRDEVYITPARTKSTGPLSESVLPELDHVDIKRIVVTPATRTWTEPITSFSIKVRVDNPDSRLQNLFSNQANQPAFTLCVYQGATTKNTPIFTENETERRAIAGNGSEFFRFTVTNQRGFDLGVYTVQVLLPGKPERSYSEPIYLE